MILDSLLAGVILFSSYAIRTPNEQPNPEDYEVSLGLSQKYFHINRQWERELGTKYIDDLAWMKIDAAGVYFKPEYMNKESQEIRYLKIDWRNKWKYLTYGFTTRNDESDLFSSNFVTFVSVGMGRKKTFWDKVEVEATIDGYFPPDDSGVNTTFEYENKFKISWKVSDKVRVYKMGEVARLQKKDYFKAKIGIEYNL